MANLCQIIKRWPISRMIVLRMIGMTGAGNALLKTENIRCQIRKSQGKAIHRPLTKGALQEIELFRYSRNPFSPPLVHPTTAR